MSVLNKDDIFCIYSNVIVYLNAGTLIFQIIFLLCQKGWESRTFEESERVSHIINTKKTLSKYVQTWQLNYKFAFGIENDSRHCLLSAITCKKQAICTRLENKATFITIACNTCQPNTDQSYTSMTIESSEIYVCLMTICLVNYSGTKTHVAGENASLPT